MKISVVSYINSIPFVQGIQQSGMLTEKDKLFMDNPADCAHRLINHEVDIGLVPVAVIPEIKNANIVSDYCIGAARTSLSVLLLSPVPVSEIETVFLDQESRTSAMLLKILFRYYWKKNVVFSPLNGSPDPDKPSLLIGDKTFVYQAQYPCHYDLSEVWNEMTGMPFVFACWVANKELPEKQIKLFNDALAYGVSHIEEMLEQDKSHDEVFIDKLAYLTNHISFIFDEQKKEAMRLFLEYMKKEQVLT